MFNLGNPQIVAFHEIKRVLDAIFEKDLPLMRISFDDVESASGQVGTYLVFGEFIVAAGEEELLLPDGRSVEPGYHESSPRFIFRCSLSHEESGNPYNCSVRRLRLVVATANAPGISWECTYGGGRIEIKEGYGNKYTLVPL